MIEINGLKYRERELPKRKPISKTMTTILTMSAAFGFTDFYDKRSKQMLSVDIVKEYELIQQKKSKLSRSKRDWVVWEFERYFELV